ncbi:MAG: hypothetical protein ABIR91_04380 [Candidatus Saccharimonadales bacterium]
MNNPEQERIAPTVTLIAPEGLGFGEGGVSVKTQIERGILTSEAPKHIYEVLMNDPNVFKKVEASDDGCGDGRPWNKVIQMTTVGGQKKIQLYKTSLLRAKVFGGGLVTASSMWRTINGTPGDGVAVAHDRGRVAEELARRGVSHGAHSDDHAEGQNSGCGAIDNYQVITANAVKYRSEITATLQVLYGDAYEENRVAVDEAFAVYESVSENAQYFSDASGKQSMEQILQSGAVVKELAGGHMEETIVLSDVYGTTLDQPYFTQTVKNACIEEQKPQTIQAFSVDIWRGKEIASTITAIACEQDPTLDPKNVYQLGYADFLIRTLAVASTLTPGDRPVYLRQG